MTFKAKIDDVHRNEDQITVDVEFTDGETTFTRFYPFVHMVDIDTNFRLTIKNELKRMNDLHSGYDNLVKQIGTEIHQDK